MTSLRTWLSNKLVTKEEKIIVAIIATMIIFGTIGFGDATHLTISHYTGADLRCGNAGGCNTVTGSAYSAILGIPVALLGALYYASVILLAIAYLDTKKEKLLRVLTVLPIAGLVASLWFVYLQLFVIHSICIYCMVSAGTSTVLFILSQLLRVRIK